MSNGGDDSGAAEQLVGPTSAAQFVSDWADGPGGVFIIDHEISLQAPRSLGLTIDSRKLTALRVEVHLMR